jgi:hypothetical protein
LQYRNVKAVPFFVDGLAVLVGLAAFKDHRQFAEGAERGWNIRAEHKTLINSLGRRTGMVQVP